MNIINLDIKEIVGNEDNPRTITETQFKRLCMSIQSFPQMMNIRPLVIDPQTKKVLGGNMRLMACKALGWKEVPVIMASDLTEDQKKEFIIKDNANYGIWDWEMLLKDHDVSALLHWGVEVELDDDQDDEMIDYAQQDTKEAKEPVPKNSITIKFGDNYKQAVELVEFWEDQNADIGALLIEKLKSEKDKLSIL